MEDQMGRKKTTGQQPLTGVRFTDAERAELDALAVRLAEPFGKRPNRADAIRYGLQLAKKGFAVPLLGDLGAGRPCHDPADPAERLPVNQLFPTDSVAYRVRGHSMQDDHILDGDFVIVRPSSDSLSGPVVAWLKDLGGTLKNYNQAKKQLHSGKGKERWIHNMSDDDLILGVLVGVIRKC